MIEINEGNMDRTIRVLLGVGLLILGLGGFVGGTAGIVVAVIGLVPLVTGIVGFCPAYRLFGLSTCPTRGAR